MHQYATVSEAINDLKKRGFTEDFNLDENCLVCTAGKFYPEDFSITEVYRFEGDSDPGDEAVVYGIESNNGLKGALVDGYGYSSTQKSTAIIQKLAMHTQ